ncbi:hypothetical protein K458DRAFT_397794 [Lentithecium fluviatile CBS 122367]|uniref:Uncharacterized protein n=1 Tax=Lentithecium fluviatile CBS 122367 TaxID=1168545 RepID=A0A6G1IC46_9PLEO|nr:hypothetical protein K458DRAFT_397794 [Lentithecium fluviatile CBS 122367]
MAISPATRKSSLNPPYKDTRRSPSTDDRELDICCIGAAPLMILSRRLNHEIFAASIADIDKALEERKYTDPATKVPREYYDLLYVFS